MNNGFTIFIKEWMEGNYNYHSDWCWLKDRVYMNGEDITKDIMRLYLSQGVSK